jgi:hypothetical protein
MLRTYVWSTWKSSQENRSTTGISITLLGVPDAPSHLKRTYLYVRQSTIRQVLTNTESGARQYALRQRAIPLG